VIDEIFLFGSLVARTHSNEMEELLLMLPQLVRSSKRNPCPICGRVKDGDCRISEDTTFTLCHSHQNLDPLIPGWKFLGHSEGGAGWGKFIKIEKTQKKQSFGMQPSTVGSTSYCYTDRQGFPLVEVQKVVKSDGTKHFRQSHFSNNSATPGCCPDRSKIPVYRYKKVQQAIADSEPIFWVEGESCADFLWSKGIAATTSIGGSSGFARYGQYSDDLKDARVVLCPDKDKKGIGYAEEVAAMLGDRVIGWCYCFDNTLWQHLQESGGADLEDEFGGTNVTKETLIARISAKKGTTNSMETTPTVKVDRSPEPSAEDLIGEVDRLIADGVHNGHLRAEMAVLSRKYRLSISSLWETYQERLKDANFTDILDETKVTVEDLLAADRANLPVAEVLPRRIAGAVNMAGSLLGVRPETYLLSILTATSAAINSKTRVSVCPALGWVEPPNLYGAIVAESSQRKTPILKAAIYQPFRSLDRRSEAEFEDALDRFDRDEQAYNALKPADRADSGKKKPVMPVRKLHLVSDPSAEGLIAQGMAHPEKTLLYIRDELSGVFGDLNKYRGGKGSDRQLLLETFNGAAIKSVRAGRESKSHDELLLSIFGGIQPAVLKKILGSSEDSDGLWSRFLYCLQPTVAAPTLPPYGTPNNFDLGEILSTIYQTIDLQEAREYHLDEDAYKLFSVYRDRLEQLRVDRDNCPLIRHFAGKLQGIVARLALNLHIFWAAAGGGLAADAIGLASMVQAIEVAEFSLAQIKILAADFEQEQDSSQIFRLIQTIQEKGTATIREIQRHVTRTTADAARSLIAKAVGLNFVRWVDDKTVTLQNPEVEETPAPTIEESVTVSPPPAARTTPVAVVDRAYPKPGQKVRCHHHVHEGKIVQPHIATVGRENYRGGFKTTEGLPIDPDQWLKIWFPAT
jgi:hypothetical protein